MPANSSFSLMQAGALSTWHMALIYIYMDVPVLASVCALWYQIRVAAKNPVMP